MNRTWTYAYAGSDLTSVTDPMGHVTSYTYDTTNANPMLTADLLTITAPNAQPGGPDAGKDTVMTYDTLGQVTTQTDHMGYATTFSYCPDATASDCMDSSTGTGLVTATDSAGNTTLYAYQQGALAAQTTYTGTLSPSHLVAEQDYIPDTTAPSTSNPVGGTLLDTATHDGDQNPTSYTYNSSWGILNSSTPDGIGNEDATTTYWPSSAAFGNDTCTSDAQASTSCSAAAGPTPVAPGGVIAPPAGAPPQGFTWTLYDTNGNELYNTTGVYEPGASSASYSQTSYQLFKGNSVTLPGTDTPVTCTATPPSPSLPCGTINADDVVTQLAYDAAGDLISRSVPDGNSGGQLATTTYAYDADGEQTATTAPDGNLPGANAGNYTTGTAYNSDGEQTSVTQAGGSGATATPRTASYVYDADGNQTTSTDARGYVTTTSYNADDEPTLSKDPDGNLTLTCYDGDGNITETVPPAGVSANNLTPASCPATYPGGYGDRLAADATTYTYDADGNETQTTAPAPAGQTGYETTTFTYDGDGNPTRVTAPPDINGGSNQVTVDTYNDAGEVAAETVGYGTSAASTTAYCYDPDGDQTAVIAPDGNTTGTAQCNTNSSYPWIVDPKAYPAQAAYQTTATFDSAGELVSTTSPGTTAAPGGAITAYTWDPAGRQLTSTDPDGVTTSWSYNPQGLPSEVSYSGSAAHSISYTYDADGNKTAMTDASGSSSYTWDSFGGTR